MDIRQRERMTRERLKRYQATKKKIKEAYEDIEAGQLGSRSGDPVQSSGHSDPTARGAERLLNLAYDETWISAIDDAMRELRETNKDIEQIVRRHFRLDSAKGYNRKYNGRVRRDLMDEQAISDTEYYSRLSDGINTVMVFAAERGLFRDVCEKTPNYSNIN